MAGDFFLLKKKILNTCNLYYVNLDSYHCFVLMYLYWNIEVYDYTITSASVSTIVIFGLKKLFVVYIFNIL